MEYLALSILSSTCIFLVFRLFTRFGIDNFQAIVFNYITAATIGYFLDDTSFRFDQSGSNTWIWVAVITGVMFITMFNIIAVTTQKIGVAVASVAAKVSLIIPVTLALYLYGDEMPLLKAAGILLAIIAVFLTFYSPDEKLRMGRLWIFPATLFIGTGLLDTLMKFTQSTLLGEEQFNIFSSILFMVAGVIGVAVMLISMALKGGKLQVKNAVAGIVLGIPNYGSIYFLLNAFEHSNLESSVIFPVNNMGIVACSAIAAYALFRERLTALNWVGIAASIAAIAVISFA